MTGGKVEQGSQISQISSEHLRETFKTAVNGCLVKTYTADQERYHQVQQNTCVVYEQKLTRDPAVPPRLGAHCSRFTARFTDDNKLFEVVKAKRICEDLKKEIAKLGEWVIEWQM